MSETGPKQKDRPKARLGPLSILCFLGGIGLISFLCIVVSNSFRGPLVRFGFLIAMELGVLAWGAGLVLGLMGLYRHERPLWPAVIGCLLVSGVVFLFLFPAGGARRKAPRANCLSNEKQILLAMAMYADNYGGRLPMDSTNPTLVGSMKLLSNIVTTAKIFHCPDDQRAGARAETDYKRLTTLNISYSYVPNLKWQDTPDSPVILDRIYSTTNGSTWPADGNHKGQGGNVGFLDGHVQWCNVLPAALKDKDGKQVVLSP